MYNPETGLFFNINKRNSPDDSESLDDGEMMSGSATELTTVSSEDTAIIGTAFGAAIGGLLIITLVVLVLIFVFVSKLKHKSLNFARRSSQLQQPAVSKFNNPVYSSESIWNVIS